jgi:ferrous iron transport protein A
LHVLKITAGRASRLGAANQCLSVTADLTGKSDRLGFRLRFSLNKQTLETALATGWVIAVNTEPLMPLDLLKPGEWADVAEVEGDPACVSRMAELGLRTGCRLLMLQGGCPCLLQVEGCRLSIRTESLTQIFVRPIACPA